MGDRSYVAAKHPSVVLGLWLVPVLLALSWLVLGGVPLPHALLALGVSPLATVLALPLGAVCLFVSAAVVASVQRREAAHWISLAAGTLVGTVALLAVALGLIGALTWMVA